MNQYDVIIIGAGASGLMCAAEAAKRGRRTLLLEQGKHTGRKILVAGGGKCNFTNNDIGAENYLSDNSHFCKSALSRYTQWDFLSLVENHQIPWEERNHGQLFTTSSARDIRDMLMTEVSSAGCKLKMLVQIESVEHNPEDGYLILCGKNRYSASSLVIATGGVSLPSVGVSPFGYKIAEQFGLPLSPISSGLVPLTLERSDKEKYAPLAGIAVEAVVGTSGVSFRENLLFTHRGLSGPAILQASNYWHSGEPLLIDLCPDIRVSEVLEKGCIKSPAGQVKICLSQYLPKRLISALIPESIADRPLKTLSPTEISLLEVAIHQWKVKPNGTEGARTAEVTRGGVSVNEVSSRTFEANKVPGLYFIGEVLDVTGWLGGYNLQWAWSSGWCAGQFV